MVTNEKRMETKAWTKKSYVTIVMNILLYLETSLEKETKFIAIRASQQEPNRHRLIFCIIIIIKRLQNRIQFRSIVDVAR